MQNYKILFIYLQIRQSYVILSTDYFMTFYISVEKCEKLQYLCNRTTNLHKI